LLGDDPIRAGPRMIESIVIAIAAGLAAGAVC